MTATTATVDPLVEDILDVFAHEARIERSRLRLDARADELGVTSLDFALAMFEIEARFGVTLVEPPPGTPAPTVGELVQQVLAGRRDMARDAPTNPPTNAAINVLTNAPTSATSASTNASNSAAVRAA